MCKPGCNVLQVRFNKGQNKSSQSNSKACITSRSRGARYARPLNSSVMQNMKTGIGLFVSFIGLTCILMGFGFLMNVLSFPSDGVSCKAICGLGSLFSQLFGQSVGKFVVGFIWVLIGFFLCAFSYRASR